MDKTVLIIAYYFPPVKGAAPWRPYSWCQYFGQQQLKTTVITRHWQGFESNWAQMTAPNFEPPKVGIEKDYTLIQLPTKAWCLYTFYRNYLFKIPGLSALFFAFAAALGRFGLEVDAYTTFAAYLINHLKTNNYDAIVVTYPPSNLLKLLPLLRKHSRAKIIVDFRDWLNNEMLQHNYKPGIKQQYLNYCQSCYAKKHLKFADAVTVVTPAFTPLVQALYKGPVHLIYNGYEHELLASLSKQKQRKFTIAYIGNMYANMNMDLLLDGLQIFLKNKTHNIQVQFIGVASQQAMLQKINAFIPQPFLITTPMLDKQEALQYTKNADVLLQFGWTDYNGIVGTKTFDYMASGNPILLAPADVVMQQLFDKTNAGITVSTTHLFVQALETWYDEWKQNGHIKWHTHLGVVETYSRKNQSNLMAALIFETLNTPA